jgi:hypothetical protein
LKFQSPKLFQNPQKIGSFDERIGSFLGSSIFSQTRNQFFNVLSTTVMNFNDCPDNHQWCVPVSDDSPPLVLSPYHVQRPYQPRNNPLVLSPTNYLLGISSKATMTIGAPMEQWNSNFGGEIHETHKHCCSWMFLSSYTILFVQIPTTSLWLQLSISDHHNYGWIHQHKSFAFEQP